MRRRVRSLVVLPYDECIEIDSEDSRGRRIEREFLEEGGLDECIGLHTLRLLHSHFQAITADEASCYLRQIKIHEVDTICTNLVTSLKLTVLRIEDNFLAFSILATSM